MTNEKWLGVILLVFVVGAIGYFVFSKFNQDVKEATVSPSPSPSLQELNFTFNKPASSGESSQSQPLLLETNKHLDKFPGVLKQDVLQNSAGEPSKKAVIQTNKGTIEIEIFPQTPVTSSNFLVLASQGFYDGLTFHRVEPGFVIQGGDPKGDGTGGPGYEFNDEPVTLSYQKGIVAMANSGPNTNGSQFFIMLADHPELPKLYTIFGKVTKGIDVVEQIAVGDKMQKVAIQNFQ